MNLERRRDPRPAGDGSEGANACSRRVAKDVEAGAMRPNETKHAGGFRMGRETHV